MNITSFVKNILENDEQDKFIKDILELAKKPTQAFSESEPSVPQEPGEDASPEEKKEYEEKKKKHDEWEKRKQEVEQENEKINNAKKELKDAYGDDWEKQEILDKDGHVAKEPADGKLKDSYAAKGKGSEHAGGSEPKDDNTEEIKKMLDLAKQEPKVFDEPEPEKPGDAPADDATDEEKKEYEDKKKKHDEWENKKKEAEETNKSIDDAKEKMKKAYGDDWATQEIINSEGKLAKQPSDSSIFKKTLSAEDKAKLDEAMKKFEDIYKESDEYKNAEDKEEALKKYQEKAEKFKNSIIESGKFEEDKLKDFDATSNKETSASSSLEKIDGEIETLNNEKADKKEKIDQNNKKSDKEKKSLEDIMFGKDGNNGLAGIPIIGFFATLAYTSYQLVSAGMSALDAGTNALKPIGLKAAEYVKNHKEEKLNEKQAQNKILGDAIKCMNVPDEYKDTQKAIVDSLPDIKIPDTDKGKELLKTAKDNVKSGKSEKVFELVAKHSDEIAKTAKTIDDINSQNSKLTEEITAIDEKISTKEKIKKSFNSVLSFLGFKKKEGEPEPKSTGEGEPEPKSTGEGEPEPNEDDEEFEITDSDGTKKTYKFWQGERGGWHYNVIKDGKKGPDNSCSKQDMSKMKKSLKFGKAPKEPTQTNESILANYISNNIYQTANITELKQYITEAITKTVRS